MGNGTKKEVTSSQTQGLTAKEWGKATRELVNLSAQLVKPQTKAAAPPPKNKK